MTTGSIGLRGRQVFFFSGMMLGSQIDLIYQIRGQSALIPSVASGYLLAYSHVCVTISTACIESCHTPSCYFVWVTLMMETPEVQTILCRQFSLSYLVNHSTRASRVC
jgi:hypothetical protein